VQGLSGIAIWENRIERVYGEDQMAHGASLYLGELGL